MIGDFCEQLTRRIQSELFGETYPRELGGVLHALIHASDADRLRQKQGEAKALIRVMEIVEEERRKF